MTTEARTARSTTKSVTVARSPDYVFSFIADGSNWPKWAVANVKAASRGNEADWWNLSTPHGPARLRIRAQAEQGLLDHDWIDSQASWTVPARVVPNGDGAEFLMTFSQPPSFSDPFFDEQIKLVDIELAKLKEVLEAR
jgi:hypothetical protein